MIRRAGLCSPAVWIAALLVLLNIAAYLRGHSDDTRAHAVTLRQLAVSAISSRAQIDEDPIHVILAYCTGNGQVDKADNGLTTVRSILMARENGVSRNRKYVFHVVADDIVGRAMLEARNATRPWAPGDYPDRDTILGKWGDVLRYIAASEGRIELQRYHWRDLDAAILAALGPDAMASVPRWSDD